MINIIIEKKKKYKLKGISFFFDIFIKFVNFYQL